MNNLHISFVAGMIVLLLNNLHILLDLAAGALILGLLLAGAYETIAVINTHIPFTSNLPLITDIVRP